jgi:tRNA A37 threonylcarbamoyladenosine modification protein TsaB
MYLIIDIKNKIINLNLKKQGKIISKISFPDEHNLMEKLLPAIDRLLKKNKLEIKDIKKAQVFSDQADSYTTARIAKAVAGAINFTLDKTGA